MKKLLIFDAYGTLLSTGKGSLEATKKILALQEKEIDPTIFYKDWKKYHRKHLDEANASKFILEKEIFAKDLEALYEQYQINRPHEKDVEIMLESLIGRVVFPEVAEAIRELRKKYRVVIGSTTDTEPLLVNLKNNGLEVDAVYTSEMIQKYKPTQMFYQYILQEEGYKAEDAVFIGDSLVDDVEGPQRVEITTILVDRNEQFIQTGDVCPNYIVRGIREIVELEL